MFIYLPIIPGGLAITVTDKFVICSKYCIPRYKVSPHELRPQSNFQHSGDFIDLSAFFTEFNVYRNLKTAHMTKIQVTYVADMDKR